MNNPITFPTDALCDLHVHLRHIPEVIRDLIRFAIEGGADTLLPIPNFPKGLSFPGEVVEYIKTVKNLIPEGITLNILPTMMVNENTKARELIEAVESGISDVKLMPFGRSTNSDFGFHYFWKLIPLINWCGDLGIRVHLHPEHPWQLFGNRDAEYQCLTFAEMALTESPDVKFFWEHGTDARCIPFWEELAAKTGRFFVTLTAHHLASNEEQSFGDVRRTCKPPIKTERDRSDLCLLVAKRYPWVLAGGDGATHPDESKHVTCGKCACGANTSRFLLQLYAHALHPVLNLGTLNGQQAFKEFTSTNGRLAVGVSAASRQVTLVNRPYVIPMSSDVGLWRVMSYGAGETIDWSIER